MENNWQDNKKKRYEVERLKIEFDAEQNLTADELEVYGKRLAEIVNPSAQEQPR